jgi:secreted trypsin-like serine protease
MKIRLPSIGASIAVALFTCPLPAPAQQLPDSMLPFDYSNLRLGTTKSEPISDQKRIYDGQAAPPGAYPFMVALINAAAPSTSDGLFRAQFCGGSLFSNRWVVTAGHCVTATDNNNKPRLLRAEEVDVYGGSNEFRGGQRMKIKRVVRHPQYDHGKKDFDIALLELAASAKWPGTSSISLITPANENELVSPGKPVIAAGWGELESGASPTNLRHVSLDIIDSGVCNANLVKYRVGANLATLQRRLELGDDVITQIRLLLESRAGRIVTDNMICSGKLATKRDTCQGDSGGPLFSKLPDGRFVQVGITSWGEGCGQSERGLYGIYTRVAKFAPWVEQQTK